MRWHPHRPGEVAAQIGRRAKTAQLRDPVHRQIAALQQLPGARDPLALQPSQRRRARGGVEAADQGARAGVGAAGEVGDGQRFVQPLGGPVQQRGERVVGALRQRRLDVLGLAAGPMGGRDELPGQGVGRLGAVVLAHQMQTDVDAGRGARPGQHIAVVDVEHGRIEPYGRIALGEQRGVHPVGGRRTAVEKSGRGEGERARAQRHDAGAAPMGLTQRGDQLLGGIAAHIGRGRDDHRVRGDQFLGAVRGVGGEP
ncbi:hypothetical protein GCM10009680_11780 [Streptomyces yatensis]|uniref:Uncharacterized protein n=1 Tax=Streptomyces yatensis TaxID=155177 RepID=A0ABN2GML0_9ACTN